MAGHAPAVVKVQAKMLVMAGNHNMLFRTLVAFLLPVYDLSACPAFINCTRSDHMAKSVV